MPEGLTLLRVALAARRAVCLLLMLLQGVDAVSRVYLHPDNAKSREKFELLWTTISGGVPTVPVVLR